MYVPEKWLIKDKDRICQFLEEYAFATVVTESLGASHVPLLFERNEKDDLVLYGHFSKNNTQANYINNGKALAIFHGPHNYISPSWYEKRPAVPTWNYSVVHAHGTLSITDKIITLNKLNKLVEKFDPELDPKIIDSSYKEKLLGGIVGFKIVVEDIQGKEKLGQHRCVEDQRGVIDGLRNSNAIGASELLDYMLKHKVGIGE